MLVTGASIFLGGHLVELLVDKGYSVVCMVRKTSNTSILDRLGLEKRVADLTDPPALRKAVCGTEAVLHLAPTTPFTGRRDCTTV